MAESTSNWQFEEPDGERIAREKPSRRLLVIAVGFSLLLHGAIATALLFYGRKPPAPPTLGAVRIHLLPTNPLTKPLQPDVIAEPATESSVNKTEVQAETPVDEVANSDAATSLSTSPSLSPLPIAPAPDIVEISESTPSTTAGNSERLPVFSLPTILSVQQSVQAVISDTVTRSWLYECNTLEEDSGIRTCEVGSGVDDSYQEVERNAFYEALNPVRERTRTERSLRTVYANTANVAAALNSSTIPEELANYVLRELEAGTSVYTINVTGRVQHMRRMNDTSAAVQQATRVLADPWVQGRTLELQQRKVHTD